MKIKEVHLLSPEFRRGFGGMTFLGAVVLTILFKIMDLISSPAIGDYFTQHIKSNAIYLMGMGGDGLLIFASFCFCAFPASSMYAEDYQQNAVYMRIQRFGGRHYVLSRILFAFLSAGSCMFLAEVICMLMLVLGFGHDLFPAVGTNWDGSHLLEEGKIISYWIIMVGTRSLQASFYALSALAFSIVCPNWQATIAFPLLFSYFNQYILGSVSFIPDYLKPSLIYEIHSTEALILGISEWQGFSIVLLYTFLIACLVGVALYCSLKRQGTFGGYNE